MKIISPITISADNEEILLSSTLPEDDYAEWNVAATYARGNYVMSLATHSVYRSLTNDNLGTDPDAEEADANDPFTDPVAVRQWQRISATNRWKMFDQKPSVAAEDTANFVEVELQPNTYCNGLAAFNVLASRVEIDVTSASVQRRNLLTYSEQFDNASWIKVGATVTANTDTAPDGTVTADNTVENTDNSEHFVSKSFTVTSGQNYVFSTHIKQGSGSRRFRLRTALDAGANSVDFNFDTGALTVTQLSSLVSSGFTVLGNGWFRVWMVVTATGTGSGIFRQQLVDSGLPVYTGDGTSGIYLWGAQLEEGTEATPYQSVEDALTFDQSVYSNTIFLQDNSQVMDINDYYFLPITTLSEFVVTDIPPYADAVFRVRFVGSDLDPTLVKCGQIALGPVYNVGSTGIGDTGFTGFDLSFVNLDEFGDVSTTVRAATRTSDFEVFIENSRLLGFDTLMQSLRGARRAVWVGDDDNRKAAINYGYYLDYRSIYKSADHSLVNIQVQGVT